MKTKFNIPESQHSTLEEFIQQGHAKVLEIQKKEVQDFLDKEGLTLETLDYDLLPGHLESMVYRHRQGIPYYGAMGEPEGCLEYSFAPNNVAEGIKVTNLITKESIDLSGYDEW
jgi:hypothetical protein